MTDNDYPPFSMAKPRFDQSNYIGRLKHFLDVIDPRTLLTSDAELEQSLTLLKKYENNNNQIPAGVTNEEMWDAKKIKDAIIHPVTNEKMLVAGRMSSFVPMNVPIAFGMLTLATTPATTIFWHWINQSYNVVNNYTNRSGAEVDTEALAKAYGLAVGVSCTIAVAAGAAMKRAPPAVKRMGLAVPYFAVITAGCSNVAFTRMEEMKQGVPVMDHNGNTLGVSQKAGIEGVKLTVLSRSCFLPIFPLVLPPLIMSAANKVSAIRSNRPVAIFVELLAITACMAVGLPAAIAIFPQEVELSTSKLEDRFQNLLDSDGNLLTTVLINKGL